MKNKNGFTLIELVAVVALIAVVGIVVVISITSQVKQQEEKEYKLYKETILDSAELYIELHRNLYPSLVDTGDTIYITAKDIIGANLLREDLKNPKTEEYVDENMKIKVTMGEDNIIIYEIEGE